MFHPCLEITIDADGVTVGRFRQHRYAWREIGGLVLHGEKTLRVLVVRDGRARVYACTAAGRASVGSARPVLELAAECSARAVRTSPAWTPAQIGHGASFVLSALLVAPALFLVFASLTTTPTRVFVVLVAAMATFVVDRAATMRSPFPWRVDPLRAWEDARVRHRAPEYR